MSDKPPIPPFAATDFDRRTFLDALLAVGFVSTGRGDRVSGRALSDSTGQRRAGDADGRRRPVGKLGLNTAAIFKFGSKPGIVVRTAEGEIRAFSAVCTHLDCTVQFKNDTRNSGARATTAPYDLGGAVVSGPPPRGLEQFVVNLRGEGDDAEIVVSRS
jgi:Rieske Fe-S protein